MQINLPDYLLNEGKIYKEVDKQELYDAIIAQIPSNVQETPTPVVSFPKMIDYVTIDIPTKIQKMKLKDLELGKRLMEWEDKDWFPDIDMNQKVWVKQLLIEKKNRQKEGKAWVNISARDCLKEAPNCMTIEQCLILGEVIKERLGMEYIDFEGYMADSRYNGYEKVKEKIKTIDETFGIEFGEYTTDWYIVRNRGIYIDKKGIERAFIRGAYADYGCVGGVCSVNLGCGADRQYDGVGFRACSSVRVGYLHSHPSR